MCRLLIFSQPLDDNIEWEMMGKGEFLTIDAGSSQKIKAGERSPAFITQYW